MEQGKSNFVGTLRSDVLSLGILQIAGFRVAASSIGPVGFAGEVVCERLVKNLVAARRGIVAREVPVADCEFRV